MRTTLRTIVTLLAFPLLPVFYLNIETVAERYGWNAVLADLLVGRADGLLSFALHPITLLFSILVMGLAAGVWLDALAKKFDASTPSKAQVAQFDRTNFANELLALAWKAEKFTANPFLYENEGPQIQSEIFIMMDRLNRLGYELPQPKDGNSIDRFQLCSRYFRTIAPLINSNHINEAKGLGAIWNKNDGRGV